MALLKDTPAEALRGAVETTNGPPGSLCVPVSQRDRHHARPRLRLGARLPRSPARQTLWSVGRFRGPMKEKKAPSVGGKPLQSGADLEVQAHLGRKLRELFEAPFSPLPQRLIELLESLAAKDNDHPAVNASLKDALLAMIPNLRAFAVSLCGNPERADDLVQETLLKACSHIDSFQEGTNLR